MTGRGPSVDGVPGRGQQVGGRAGRLGLRADEHAPVTDLRLVRGVEPVGQRLHQRDLLGRHRDGDDDAVTGVLQPGPVGPVGGVVAATPAAAGGDEEPEEGQDGEQSPRPRSLGSQTDGHQSSAFHTGRGILPRRSPAPWRRGRSGSRASRGRVPGRRRRPVLLRRRCSGCRFPSRPGRPRRSRPARRASDRRTVPLPRRSACCAATCRRGIGGDDDVGDARLRHQRRRAAGRRIRTGARRRQSVLGVGRRDGCRTRRRDRRRRCRTVRPRRAG